MSVVLERSIMETSCPGLVCNNVHGSNGS